MRGAHAGADAPLLGTCKWWPPGQPFAMRKNRWVGVRRQYPSPSGLTTVAEQQGEIAAGTLNRHILPQTAAERPRQLYS